MRSGSAPPRPLTATVAAAALLLLPACSNLGYYAHTVGGQVELLTRARPIEEVVADPGTDPQPRRQLAAVLAIRGFASRHLKLPDNDSYREYADLGRPFAVWNVFAAPEFSTTLERWCFPFAGCVSYRGYFAQERAAAFAEELRASGLETHIGGVPAYSTLGWFDDPVLNTFVNDPPERLAALIFHELAHQVVYVKDDSVFNESFATSVEREGLRRWFARSQEAGAAGPAVEERRTRQAQFVALVLAYRDRLEEVYRGDLEPADKREQKARVLADLQEAYRRQKEAWSGYGGYDGWFAAGPNNAQIGAVAAYTALVPAFESLLGDCGGDLERFYGAVRDLANEPKAARRTQLAAGETSCAQ